MPSISPNERSEGGVQGCDDLRHGVPAKPSPDTAATGVGLERQQQLDRVDPGTSKLLILGQPSRNVATRSRARRPAARRRSSCPGFRSIAVIGMSTSRASQTSAWFNRAVGTASRGSEYCTMPGVAGHGVGETQQVAQRPAVPLAILHGLEGKSVTRHAVEPAANRPPETAPPTAEALHVGREVQDVRAGSRRRGQGSERCLPGLRCVSRRGERKGEERRLVARRLPGTADLDDPPDDTDAVSLDAGLHRPGVFERQHLRGDVIGPLLAAEQQEPVETQPVRRRRNNVRPRRWAPGPATA